MAIRSAEVSSGKDFTLRPRWYQLPGWRISIEVVAGVLLAAALWLPFTPATPSLHAAQLSLAAAVVLGFVVRRWFPWTATLVVTVATVAGWWLGATGDPFLIAGFCLFVAAERFGARRFPWWLIATGVLVLTSMLFIEADGAQDRFLGMVVGAVVLGAAWVLGVRTRQARDETALRVRAEERLRLSRDVHDVLSHALGTIGVRAGVLAHIDSPSQEQLREALREIESDSRAAMGDLRSLLNRERADDADQPASGATLEALIGDALRSARSVGVQVDTQIDDAVELASASVRTTIYRIVQESVTNVIRHAHATSCVVRVRVNGDSVLVEIRDDGRGSTSPTRDGHGLLGMRERVELLGGSIEASNPTDGGFQVRATLPLDSKAQATL